MAPPTPEAMVEIWNRALGERFPLGLELATQFLSVDVDPEASALAPAGLVVVKRLGREAWIAALVVEPHAQGRRLGSRLLEHALNSLARARVRSVHLGGDRLHLLPGVPEPGPLDFFRRHGFELAQRPLCDVHCNLAGWSAPAGLPRLEPASSWEPVLELLAGEAQDRCLWEAEESRRRGGDPGCYLLLREAGERVGLVRVQHRLPGAPAPGLLAPSIFWAAVEGPRWAGLGPLVLVARLRGRGLGLRLLQAALAHLRSLGLEAVIAGGTQSEGLWGRAGFGPWRSYRPGLFTS